MGESDGRGDTAADFDTAGSGRTVAPVPYVLCDAPGPLSSSCVVGTRRLLTRRREVHVTGLVINLVTRRGRTSRGGGWLHRLD
jgi:hypothetical protein